METATSLVPSAEEATDDQRLLGALVCVQVVPESAEVKIGRGMALPKPPLRHAAATSLMPSAEDATEAHP